ncbi:MAG: hypothetical protein DWP97_01650 [Calditrichaeota bacterium]|nr:MAG: hypothetical protein DWP97_01650 [Calditrichota bacterium]
MKPRKTIKAASEHPWDYDERLSYPRRFSPLFISVFVLFLSLSVSAQRLVIPPTPIEDAKDSGEEKLTRLQLETAEDYKDILEDLTYHVTDFIDIFTKSSKLESIQMQNELLQMLTKLQTDTYETDVSLLQGDLNRLIDKLRQGEASLRSDTNNKLLYKNFKILRLQLQSINEIIEEDIAGKMAMQAKDQRLIIAKIQRERAEEKAMEENFFRLLEMTEKIKDEAIRIKAESLDITINTEYLEELEKSIELQEDFVVKFEDYINKILPNLIIFKENDSDKIIVAPNTYVKRDSYFLPPSPPDAPDVPDPVDEVWVGVGHGHDDSYAYNYTYNYNKSDKHLQSKTLVDSVFISSKKLPINVRNKVGNLKVEGWNKNKIVVKYRIDVSANDNESVIAFLDDVELELVSKNSGVYISVLYPDIKDASRQIAGSNLILFVPDKNKVICENAFGNTSISEINNNVEIDLKNSITDVKNIRGNVEGSTKLGSINISSVQGTINIVSDKCPTSILDCRGTTNIKSSFAPIKISGSTGDLNIRNTSDISLLNHIGNIDFENSNGTITIQNLTGNLELINSYKPTYIRKVEGSIYVENLNSLITLEEINGKASVVNKSGTIKAREVSGPLFFSNPGGVTDIDFDGTLAGNSVIQSDYGKINLILSNNSNINVAAMTDGGMISNTYAQIRKEDFLSRTSVSLGKSYDTLDVKGTNSIIVISDK